MTSAPAATVAPSSWLLRWAHLLRPGGRVLDLACGSGRNLRWLAGGGWSVTGVDRDAAALEPLRSLAEVIVADVEGGPWPLGDRLFDAVVVTNYLWRPLLPRIVASVAEGGLLLYETFAEGNQTVGRPARPDFLLRHGELLDACAALHIVAYEDGFLDEPPRFVQRIAAARDAPGAAASPPRHALEPGVAR